MFEFVTANDFEGLNPLHFTPLQLNPLLPGLAICVTIWWCETQAVHL